MSQKKPPSDPIFHSVYLKFFDPLRNPIVEAEITHETEEEERKSAAFLIDKYAPQGGGSEVLSTIVEPASAVSTITLSGLIAKYEEEKKLDKSWTDKTRDENASIYGLLVEILGDVRVKAVDIHQANSVRTTLLKLPPGIKKSPLYAGRSIPEILALNPSKTLSTLTIKKYLVRFSSLFEWAERMGYADRNPFTKLSPVRTKAENKERDRFYQADLKRLFETPLFASKPSQYIYRYWVPLLALYTGARLNEICQLSVSDIRQEGSIWYFDINDEEEQKRVKTLASKRHVPLHSRLIDLGFLGYVECLKRKSESRLFPELSLSKAGYGKKAGNWFNQQYRKSCGISATEKKSFHSFRHTFVDELIKKGVEVKAVSDMVGHHVSKSITLVRYTKSYNPSQLKPHIEKLDFELDLPSHEWK